MPIAFDWLQTISALPSNPIPPEWLATKGKGVKIAIVDTGANLGLSSLKHLDTAGHKFFTSAPGFSVTKLTGQDNVGEAFGVAGSGHGTLYTALLAGKLPVPAPDDKDLVSGIANGAEIFIIKATDNSGELTTIKYLLDALKLSVNLGIEIFITGQSISRSEIDRERLNESDIIALFNTPAVKKMFVFAPLKNKRTALGWNGIVINNFPNFLPDVINVAKLPDFFASNPAVVKKTNVPFFLSGFTGQVLSKTGDAMELEFSNSGAVTILGGIAALALSFSKAQNAGASPTREAFITLLKNSCRPIDNAMGSFDQPALLKNA